MVWDMYPGVHPLRSTQTLPSPQAESWSTLLNAQPPPDWKSPFASRLPTQDSQTNALLLDEELDWLDEELDWLDELLELLEEMYSMHTYQSSSEELLEELISSTEELELLWLLEESMSSTQM